MIVKMEEFSVVQTGLGDCTSLEIIPGKNSKSVLPPITVPVGLPPVLKTQDEELEALLSHPETLPIHDLNHLQEFLPRESNPSSLFTVDTTPIQSTLVMDRDPTTGQLQGFREVPLKLTGATAKNSWSLTRKPGPSNQGVRGSSTNYPFWPGGLDEPNIESLVLSTESTEINFEKDLLTTPPGFKSGVDFPSRSLDKLTSTASSVISLGDLLSANDEISLLGDEEKEEENAEKIEETPLKVTEALDSHANLDDIIKLENRSEAVDSEVPRKEDSEKESFAIVEDVKTPVTDFYKRIPDMAHKWDFELDNFQKLAILHLENHESVLVAAHTSAGKTVVAEYAIALSMRHMTRTIYTSPIKALSNQKFHDFKKTFGDVGLITGDVQIHSESSCLIMTTEILRSMLYNGSDVIRDLEWVIFDEVHYINDAERGVVWEEVLIMLPQHVNIILLSATVPNTREFAEWVGRTKKRAVYVVSTTKRPVPLEHFLYTGNSSKTSNELYLLMDANKNFLVDGYNKALNAKKERSTKVSQSFGAKGARHGAHPSLDKNIWLSVIDMLRKKDKMPVVAFTLSKRKIDENAHHMSSVDLTTQTEKSEIHVFFQRCVSRLKGSDVKLPQVTFMGDLLRRGLGVHHSGILPILKEVVEMLFQRGLVKVLFATETFAMGVNMPARTVVFDSIRKHDGVRPRDLLPGEYIQMAGRAGRRGLDTTGTVILLCKGDVPEMSDLHKMMLGKPTVLHSQFRLTYSMILNLLRVEQLRVEDMMKRSFSEFHAQRNAGQRKEAFQVLTEQLNNMEEVIDCCGDLHGYYTACDEYFKLRGYIQRVLLSHPLALKALSPGRVIVLDDNEHKNVAALVLKTDNMSKEKAFVVLMLTGEGDQEEELDGLMPHPVDLSLFRPDRACGQAVVTIKGENIACISNKTCRISADKILDDHRKRQIPRFKGDPPGQGTTVAAQELLRIVEANPNGLTSLDPIYDLHIRDVDLVEDFQRLKYLEINFQKYMCVHEPNFSDNFVRMRANVKLREEYNNLKFLLSDESLTLLPEYQQRIEVLKKLNYIDDSNTVQLKGRVACEISNQELIITELVFENALTSLQPAEIASLLSCVVFEVKRASEANLEPNLMEAKERFLKLATSIGELQKSCGVAIPVDDYLADFHFNLMEVVYEWAKGRPFADLMNLTDVQEGIIVRCIQRLDEVLKDVRNAARIIGDPVLYQKMEEASQLIKRDIVFAASLYMS